MTEPLNEVAAKAAARAMENAPSVPLSRVAIKRVEKKYEGDQSWIETELFYNGRSYVGMSERVHVSKAAGGATRTVQATMEAITQIVGNQLVMQLQGVQRSKIADRDFVLVLIQLYFDGRVIELYGTGRTMENVTLAAARATLDALNRYLDIVLSGRRQ